MRAYLTCYIVVRHAIFMMLNITPVPYHHLPDVLLHMVEASGSETGKRTLLVIEPLKQDLAHITKMFPCKP